MCFSGKFLSITPHTYYNTYCKWVSIDPLCNHRHTILPPWIVTLLKLKCQVGCLRTVLLICTMCTTPVPSPVTRLFKDTPSALIDFVCKAPPETSWYWARLRLSWGKGATSSHWNGARDLPWIWLVVFVQVQGAQQMLLREEMSFCFSFTDYLPCVRLWKMKQWTF